MAGERKIDYHQFKINMSHKLEGKSTPKAANDIGQGKCKKSQRKERCEINK